MKIQLPWIQIALLVSVLLQPMASHCEPIQRSTRIKAAVVFYIAKFIKPTGTLRSENARLSFCIIGQDPFTSAVQELLETKKFQTEWLSERQLKEGTSNLKCNFVIVAENLSKKVTKSLSSPPLQNSITLCETAETDRHSCDIQIYQRENKAKIAILLKSIEKRGFELSAELLALAEILQ